MSFKDDINSLTSGATLTVVLFGEDGFVYTAAVGDSRAVLQQVKRIKDPPKIKYMEESSDEEEALPKPDFWELTEDHNPRNPRECRRILKSGGEVRAPK